MKRPGPTGMTILLAFAVVAAIETRTLFGMFGIELSTKLYYAAAATVIAGVLLALLALPKKDTASTA